MSRISSSSSAVCKSALIGAQRKAERARLPHKVLEAYAVFLRDYHEVNGSIHVPFKQMEQEVADQGRTQDIDRVSRIPPAYGASRMDGARKSTLAFGAV